MRQAYRVELLEVLLTCAPAERQVTLRKRAIPHVPEFTNLPLIFLCPPGAFHSICFEELVVHIKADGSRDTRAAPGRDAPLFDVPKLRPKDNRNDF